MNSLKKNHEPFKTHKSEMSKIIKSISVILAMILVLSCSKDQAPSEDDPNNNEFLETNGVPLDSFEIYEGDLGFAINARDIAKKGYKPVEAVVTVNAGSGNFTQTLALDTDTQLAQIKLSKADLTEEQINELTGQGGSGNGVEVKVDVFDNQGTMIVSQTSTETFISNPTPKLLNAGTLEETSEMTTLVLPENTFYYLQPVDENGNLESKAMTHNSGANQDNVMTTSSSPSFSGNDPSSNFSFYPVPGEENTFFVKLRSTGGFLSMASLTQMNSNNVSYTHRGPSLSIVTDVNQIQNNNNTKFRLAKTDTGIYELQTFNGTPIRIAPGIGLTADATVQSLTFGFPPITSTPIQWRLLNTSIIWNVQNIGTKFMEPVLGPATISETFNSTLTNCGQGTLSQTVNTTQTEVSTLTHGMEESFSFSSTNSVSIGANFSTEFEATFFGVGATYTASFNFNYEHSQTLTETKANWEIEEETISQSISTDRTVTVLPQTATLVYDVYQQYNNIKINFVQKFRVTAIDGNTNEQLSGEQIRSQFQFSKFGGVITAVEDNNSVVVTIRGVRNIGKFIQFESDAQDVPANCN